jgi:hypothetical protein
MPTTTTHEIDYPDGSSAITPLESHFEALAVSTDEALTSLKANIRGSNSTATIASLATSVNDLETRLALNLQEGEGEPSGPPSNLGHEGSLYWDSTNDNLYIYNNETGWKVIWQKNLIVGTKADAVQIVTAPFPANWTVEAYTYTERNGMCQLSVTVKRKAGDISGGNIGNLTMFQVTAGYRPVGFQVPGVSGSAGPMGTAYIDPATGYGVLTAIGSQIDDEESVIYNFVYIKEL